MITLLFTVCDYECIFHKLDASAYFFIKSNSVIIMRIDVANTPFMSPMSKNAGTKYTCRVNDKYLQIWKINQQLAESCHLGGSHDLFTEGRLAIRKYRAKRRGKARHGTEWRRQDKGALVSRWRKVTSTDHTHTWSHIWAREIWS